MAAEIIKQASSMDWPIFWTIIGAGFTMIGIIYQFFRNFKSDICDEIKRLENRIDSQDDRIFFLATGKTLAEAMMLEKMKRIGEENK